MTYFLWIGFLWKDFLQKQKTVPKKLSRQNRHPCSHCGRRFRPKPGRFLPGHRLPDHRLPEIRPRNLRILLFRFRCLHSYHSIRNINKSQRSVLVIFCVDTVLACSYSKLAVAGDPYAVIYSSKDCFRYDGIPPASILDRSWTGKQFHIWKKKFYKCVLLKVYGPSTEEFPLYFC